MTGFQVAAVFDRVDEHGTPYFSPDRQRLVARQDRARVLRYLQTAPMVLRANGMEPDPLSGSPSRVVPLHYRTDGEWVWQEGCAYYLQEYGVAPETPLLAHIGTRAYLPPPRLSPEILQAAGRAALAPAAGRPTGPAGEPAVRYLVRIDPDQPLERASALFRLLMGGAYAAPSVEELRSDLTWWSSAVLPFLPPGVAPPAGFAAVSEQQASIVIDLWWRAATGRVS
jgi:hypothetical protein